MDNKKQHSIPRGSVWEHEGARGNKGGPAVRGREIESGRAITEKMGTDDNATNSGKRAKQGH